MIKTCIVCENIYKRYGVTAPNSKFCSVKCKSIYQHNYVTREKSPMWQGGTREKECPQCKKIFKWEDMSKLPYSTFKQRKFCSRECSKIGQIYLKGKNSPVWKGGRYVRDKRKQSDWGKQVRQRDSFTCQDCGKRGGDLHAHHIKEFINFPDKRWDIDNGKTLCVPCHYKTYKFYRNQFTVTM